MENKKILLPYADNKNSIKRVMDSLFSAAASRKKKFLAVPQISFLGAAQTVTGSKYLVEYADKKIMVDSGLFQGLKDDRIKNRINLPIAPKNIDCILLTHAHLDHSGYIPLLVKYGFKGKVYCTQATYELCKLILPDSGFLQEEDAKYAKKHKYSKHANPEPLYTQEDAVKSLKNFKIVRFDDEVQIDENISFHITRIGHILGAGSITLSLGKRKVVFSGDIGRKDDDILFDPQTVEEADYVVTESTYGDRLHKHIDSKQVFADIINRTVSRGGNIIVPAFAVGRTQTLLYYIYKLRLAKAIPNIPVFLDSPMSIKATNLMDDFVEEHKLTEEECFKIYEGTKFTTTVEQSKRIFDCKVPSIIISASGMATGGRVLHHLAHYAPDNKNTILLVGYQSAGTRGRDLMDGKKELKIHGQIVRVNAEVCMLENMSAHADRNEILDWLKALHRKPKKIFVTHGEERSANSLGDAIESELGINAVVPEHFQIEQLP